MRIRLSLSVGFVTYGQIVCLSDRHIRHSPFPYRRCLAGSDIAAFAILELDAVGVNDVGGDTVLAYDIAMTSPSGFVVVKSSVAEIESAEPFMVLPDRPPDGK